MATTLDEVIIWDAPVINTGGCYDTITGAYTGTLPPHPPLPPPNSGLFLDHPRDIVILFGDIFFLNVETYVFFKGVVIIYGKGWGGANLKIACTQNLPPVLPELVRYLFAPPPWILRAEILPPIPFMPIHLHVNLLEVMVL